MFFVPHELLIAEDLVTNVQKVVIAVGQKNLLTMCRQMFEAACRDGFF